MNINMNVVVLVSLLIIFVIHKIFKKKEYENTKINFGKYYGKKYSELPREYLTWLSINADDPHSQIKKYKEEKN
jgi:hypothetical protein